MIISNNYAQPQFKAGFKTSNVQQNRTRWNNIGKIFSEATKASPDDNLVLGYTKSAKHPEMYLTLGNADNKADRQYVPNLGDWFLTKSNEEIADNLVKVYNGMKIKSEALKEYDKLQDKVYTEDVSAEMKAIRNNYAQDILNQYGDDKEMLKIFGAWHFDNYGARGIADRLKYDYTARFISD